MRIDSIFVFIYRVLFACKPGILFRRTEFIVTGSCDGHVKFWKKTEDSMEFVKHFRSHLGAIVDMVENYNGTLLCTAATDEAMKIFDIINFGSSPASFIINTLI